MSPNSCRLPVVNESVQYPNPCIVIRSLLEDQTVEFSIKLYNYYSIIYNSQATMYSETV